MLGTGASQRIWGQPAPKASYMMTHASDGPVGTHYSTQQKATDALRLALPSADPVPVRQCAEALSHLTSFPEADLIAALEDTSLIDSAVGDDGDETLEEDDDEMDEEDIPLSLRRVDPVGALPLPRRPRNTREIAV